MPRSRSLALLGGCLAALLIVGLCVAQSAPKRILVYTRNYTPDGKGYVHENIAASVEAFRRIGAQHGITVDTSADPAAFTPANLSRYDALVFSNSNNDAFATDAQRDAFRAYIHAGHGFVAVHSASGSERNWPYFQQVLGGHFAFHPPQQSFTVTVADPASPVTRSLPASFRWTDECYFLDRLAPDLHILLTTPRDALALGDKAADARQFPSALPLAWTQTFDNSREFYIALGHNIDNYDNPLFTGILERGLLWTLGMNR
ncbi:ThuA domain-containing protein [Terriglobus aquaticus]|uniref:ThuA domain-containing protein n=1 Tax=Terriglobus aquaticus TaxID=940139 RepID=A0ABW9KK11_9BACT|nr:ThuA domain-containing protein [Terriglobus aquaticus]